MNYNYLIFFIVLVFYLTCWASFYPFYTCSGISTDAEVKVTPDDITHGYQRLPHWSRGRWSEWLILWTNLAADGCWQQRCLSSQAVWVHSRVHIIFFFFFLTTCTNYVVDLELRRWLTKAPNDSSQSCRWRGCGMVGKLTNSHQWVTGML